MADKTIADFIGKSEYGDSKDPPYKGGIPSAHPLGVLYQGPWTIMGDGFSEHIRRVARAIAMTGCPVQLRAATYVAPGGAPRELPEGIAPLLTASISRYSATVHQMLPDPVGLGNQTMHRYTSSEFSMSPDEIKVLNHYKVISTVFERESLGDDAIRALKLVGQVWVACQSNKDSLVASGLLEPKVRIVPVPFFEDDPLLELRLRERKQGGPVRFYHIGKWEPRKSQNTILAAFLVAFKPGDAHLLMRTSPFKESVPGYPMGPSEAINAYLHQPTIMKNGWTINNIARSVQIITDRVSPSDIVRIHGMSDVYVTLSRGEGFDMPAFDAKLAGNMMIYTPSGGPQDFAGRSDELVPAIGMVDAHPFYRWEPGAKYLDFAFRDAVRALKNARDRILSTGRPAPTNLERFAAKTVGASALRNLEDVVAPGKVF